MVTNKSKRYFFPFFSCWRWNVVLFWQFTVVHLDLISNIFLRSFMQVELLEWNFWYGADLQVGPGFSGRLGLKVCQNISGLHTKLFYNIKSNDFFLSWRRFVVLNAVTSVSDLIVIFVQLILFANTAAFLYSLLELVSHCFWESESGEEISTRWRYVENINHSRDSWLVLRSLRAGFSYL